MNINIIFFLLLTSSGTRIVYPNMKVIDIFNVAAIFILGGAKRFVWSLKILANLKILKNPE